MLCPDYGEITDKRSKLCRNLLEPRRPFNLGGD